MDLLYSFLKVTSMIATGAFGALGLLTKYKDDQGKITKWGKIALGGILISSVISLSLYIIETSKAKTAAIKAQIEAKATAEKLETILVNAQLTAEQQKRSLEETNILKSGLEKALDRSDYIAKGMENSLAAQQSVLVGNRKILGGVTNTVQKQGELLSLNTSTLNEVNRGLYPIKDVRISYSVRVPMDHIQVKGYIKRFEEQVNSLLDRKNNRLGFEEEVIGNDGNVNIFWFGIKSPLAPDISNEHLAYWLLDYFKIELWFFKTPINPIDIHPRIYGAPKQPDLKLSVSASLHDGNQKIEYRVKSKQFALDARRLLSDPQNWESTGKIVGIPDLIGSQMFVILPFDRESGADVSINKYLHEIQKQFELEDLFIELSDGRRFSFTGKDLEKQVDEEGYAMYSFIFPKTSEGLRKLER